MKKTILLSAAMVCGFCAFAQEGTDITPGNFRFATAKAIPWCDRFESNVNLVSNGSASDIYGSNGYEQWWNDGLWVLGSAGQNENQQTAFRESWSLVDLGGEVGQVACFAGKTSGIMEVLMNLAPNMEDNWGQIKIDEEATAGFAFNLFMNPYNCPSASEGYVHVKIVYNIYSSKATQNRKVFQNIGTYSNHNDLEFKLNDGTSCSPWNDSEKLAFLESDCVQRWEDDNEPKEDEDGNYIWDPTTWVVYEFDARFSDPGETGAPYTPGRVKMFAMNGNVWNDYAFFLKECTFTQMEGEPTGANVSKTVVKYENVLTPGAGVEGVIDDINAPVEFYNLQGVKVANPENGIFIRKQGKKTTKVIL